MSANALRIEEIFTAALEKATREERDTYLAAACAGDDTLLHRVEALLKANDEAGSFLGTPPHATPADVDLQIEALTDGLRLVPDSDIETEAEGKGPADERLEFLASSAQPGSLGRLGLYEILEVIGQGGFGTVFRALDVKLNRIVAIKVPAPELASNGTVRKRFLREAEAAAAVIHEHVVTIHAIDEAGGMPFLVMQFIAGSSLEEKLKREGPLPVREVLRIGMQAAEGLAAAHKQGLIHRDVKPANILLEDGVERLKITDFGLAKAVADSGLTQSGVIAGTPMYMAPEQAQGEPLDQRADLFSLGSVLYTICTGRPPFRANSTMAVLRRICDDVARPIREINHDIPGWLCDIITRLHAKDPARRYQSATEVAELLRDCLARLQRGVPVTLPPSQAGTATARRRRTLAVMAGAFLLTVCLCGFGLWLLTRGSFQGLPWDPNPASSGALSQEAKDEAPPAADANLLKDALLVMDFEKDSFYQQDGKTFVRDLSGHGNDALCTNVAFTPDGQAGGGLANAGAGDLQLPRSLVVNRSSYTITAWMRLDALPGKEAMILYRTADRGDHDSGQNIFGIFCQQGERPYLFYGAWHEERPGNWVNGTTPGGLFKMDEWFFLAVRLEDGGEGRGRCIVTVNGRGVRSDLQMVKFTRPEEVADYVFVRCRGSWTRLPCGTAPCRTRKSALSTSAAAPANRWSRRLS